MVRFGSSCNVFFYIFSDRQQPATVPNRVSKRNDDVIPADVTDEHSARTPDATDDVQGAPLQRPVVTSRADTNADDTFTKLEQTFVRRDDQPEVTNASESATALSEKDAAPDAVDTVFKDSTADASQSQRSGAKVGQKYSERKQKNEVSAPADVDVARGSGKSRFRDDIRSERAAFVAVNLPAHLLRSKEDIMSADIAHLRERLGSKELAIRKLRDNIRRSSRSSRESLDRSRENILDAPRHTPRMRPQRERRDVTRDEGDRSSDASTSQRYDYASFIARSRSAMQGDSESDDVTKRYRSAKLSRHRDSDAPEATRRRQRSKDKQGAFLLLEPEVVEERSVSPEVVARHKTHKRRSSGSRERHRDSASPSTSAPRRPRSTEHRRKTHDTEPEGRHERPKTARDGSTEAARRTTSTERRSSHLRREATFDGTTYERRRHHEKDEQVRPSELRRQQSANFPYAALILRNPEKLRPRSNRK